MIVLAVREAGGFVTQLAGHAEMHTEPGALRETKKHLFATGLGTDEFRAGQQSPQGFEIIPAEDSFLQIDFDSGNFLTKADIPAATKVFHFSKLRHGQSLGDGTNAASGLASTRVRGERIGGRGGI